jgi:hypothetical protein
VGKAGASYDKTDAAKETQSSTSQVSRAWHDARDDAAKEGGWSVPSNRHDSSKSSNSGSDNSGK